MIVTNVLSDTYARIKNGYTSNFKHIWVIKSKKVVRVLSILSLEGFIRGFSFDLERPNEIRVDLKYSIGGISAIRNIKGVSKPSSKVYVSMDTLWIMHSKNILGCYIVSTSKGVVSSKEALRLNVGGELLCYVC
jgi:small subunit ribosomal protein S8